MEPFGPGNMRPHFLIKNVLDTGYSKIVKEDHLRFVLRKDDLTFTGIGFNLADKFALLQMKSPVDIICKIDENEWNGNTSLQLRIVDLHLSGWFIFIIEE